MNNTPERFPAQLPANFYVWAKERAEREKVSLAEFFRRLPANYEAAETGAPAVAPADGNGDTDTQRCIA